MPKKNLNVLKLIDKAMSIEKSRVSPSKCRNSGVKLNDLMNVGEIANSNYERDKDRE